MGVSRFQFAALFSSALCACSSHEPARGSEVASGGSSSVAGGVGSDGNRAGESSAQHGGAAAVSGGAQNTGAVAAAGNSAGGSAFGGSTSSGGGASGGTTSAGGSTNAAGVTASGGTSIMQGGNSSAGSAGANAAAAGGSTARAASEKALKSLPQARQEHSVVAAAGEIYLIGGYNPSVTDSVVAYDPRKDTWRDVKPFPERLNHGNAGVISDKIYVAGYYVNGGMSTATTNVYSYDPKSDEWTAKSPLPMGTQRAAGCVAVDSELMYVLGGAHQGKSVDKAARYDAAKDAWEELPPLPERREHCVAGAIGGVLYVAGGRADGITGIEPKTWAFDPSTMTWSERAALPPPRGGLAGAVLADRLYVFGGEGNSAVSSGVFPDIDVYDPVSNAWTKLGVMLVPRHGYGAAVLDGRIYLPGGAIHQGAGGSDANSVFFFP